MGLWLGYDEDSFLRLYTPEGEMLLTQKEEKERADAEARRADREAERRADGERRLAELAAELERLGRKGAAPE